jgi:ABC-2 type transport system permease protein
MKQWIAFWNILVKDMRAYYLKPPNISWGILFPLAWTGMFFLRSGRGMEDLASVLPGVVAVSVLFGSTSMLAVTVTFEKKERAFDRLLLAPISLELLMLAKTAGAVLFGVAGAFVPVLLAGFFITLPPVAGQLRSLSTSFFAWSPLFGLSRRRRARVFEAQTFSNFFRFPMLFLCGLFVPLERLPLFLRPLSYALPLTYGADLLHGAVSGTNTMSYSLDFTILGAFCIGLFAASLRNIRRKWIL